MSYFTLAQDESCASQTYWAPEIKPAEVAGYSHFIDADCYEQDLLPAQQPERMILTRGSVNNLSDQDFFWSGHTLENLYFHDRQSWGLANDISYPYEFLPTTTITDIIEIFRIAAPPVFRPHKVPILCPSGSGSWYLAYLDGTADNALEFRKAVLDAFPPPADNLNGNYCTFLDIFCLGILPEIRSQLGKCPLAARVLAMIKINYTLTADASHFRFYGA